MGKQHHGAAYRRWRAQMKAECYGVCEMPDCKYPGVPIWLDAPPEMSRHPLAYTPDHIIPASKGGEHSMENGRHAHYGCNASRSDGDPRPFWWKKRGEGREGGPSASQAY